MLLTDPDLFGKAEKSIDSALAFYKAALERDNILIENALRKMEEENTSSSVMLSGGFHTMGITRILKEKQNRSWLSHRW